MRLRTICGALTVSAAVVVPSVAHASSHREAPFLTKNPKVDNTDVYAFESYETGHAGMVTLIANFQPFQDAYGGPNYFTMDPDALYEISIDNNGDGIEDYTFQFQFQTTLAASNAGASLMIGPAGAQKSIPVSFYNVGLIPNAGDTGNSSALNVMETYTVGLVVGPRRGSDALPFSNSSGTTFKKPADYVGAKSFGTTANLGSATAPQPTLPSDYAAYSRNFVYGADGTGTGTVSFPQCSASDAAKVQVFVGQRAESFAVNLGPIFDLVDAPASLVTGGGVIANYGAVTNPLTFKNITTLAIEVPRDCIWQSANQPVIGVWSTASVRQARVINPTASFTVPSKEGGAWTQVSRLGNPLVNEVVIGLPDKDKWNTSEPVNDVANFGSYVEYPTLPAIIDAIYGVDFSPTVFPRTDLVEAFLTGLPPFNAFPTTNSDGGTITPAAIPAEYIHLNTNTEALVNTINGTTTAVPTPYAMSGTQTQSRLGAALCVVAGVPAPSNSGCDPYGFPNGRRPIDDVVDIALDVVEGYLLKTGAPAYAGASPTYFTDGVDQGQTPFSATFPYLMIPTPGANGMGSADPVIASTAP